MDVRFFILYLLYVWSHFAPLQSGFFDRLATHLLSAGFKIALHGLQVLHIHALLAVPLNSVYMADRGTCQYQG